MSNSRYMHNKLLISWQKNSNHVVNVIQTKIHLIPNYSLLNKIEMQSWKTHRDNKLFGLPIWNWDVKFEGWFLPVDTLGLNVNGEEGKRYLMVGKEE